MPKCTWCSEQATGYVDRFALCEKHLLEALNDLKLYLVGKGK